MIHIILNSIILVLTLIIIKYGIDFNKKSPTSNIEPKLLPEEKNYLYKDTTYLNRGIIVTLLDLYRKNKIDIEEYKRESRNKKLADFVIEYKFTLLNRGGLKAHENIFIDNIFGQNTQVTTDELTQRAIDGSAFLSAQGKWALAIEEELANMKILKVGNKKGANKLKAFGALALIVGAFSINQSQIIGLVSLLSSLPIILVALNIGMEKSGNGRGLILKYTDFENSAKAGKCSSLNEDQLIELLSLTLTMKYFLPIYEKSNKYKSIDLVANTINEYGGSALDDAVLRAFMGFTAPTRDDSLDTNRIDYRLFK